MKCFVFRYPRNLVTDVLLSLLCSFIIVLILQNAETVTASVLNDDRYVLAVEFLNENGLKVVEESKKCDIVTIPTVFDDTFAAYNELQKEQGFDLQKYAGKKVMRFSFELSGYDEQENDIYFATVYMINNEIIAADIYSSSVNGFMTGVL